MKTFKNNSNKAGLTIIEVLIAIGLLSVTLTGAIILLINVANYGRSSEARSLAVDYAQEGLDAVRNVRDNNYCWFFSTNVNGNYIVSKSNGVWKIDPGASESILSDYVMKRTILIEDIPGTSMPVVPLINEKPGKKVTVTITWQTKGISASQGYTIVGNMYKWKY